VVPVCPGLDDGTILFASLRDRKIRDLANDPRIALSFDEYTEDWDGLLQVLVSGSAHVVEQGPDWTRGRDLLYVKFPQYEPKAEIVEGESVIVRIQPTRISSTWRHKTQAG
jgi:Pyridoxamine 5'-phosphate oxidase